jgi:hypothetical protein
MPCLAAFSPTFFLRAPLWPLPFSAPRSLDRTLLTVGVVLPFDTRSSGVASPAPRPPIRPSACASSSSCSCCSRYLARRCKASRPSGTRGGGDRLVFGAFHSTDEVTGGGIRGDGGELYSGSSCSRACGSSKDFLNRGGGENEPRTELKIDIVMNHDLAAWPVKLLSKRWRQVFVHVISLVPRACERVMRAQSALSQPRHSEQLGQRDRQRRCARQSSV